MAKAVPRQNSVAFSDYSFTETNSSMPTPPQNSSYHVDPLNLPPRPVALAGLVSSDVRIAAENVINVGVLPVLIIIGVVTNLINMAVFSRQGLGDRINICLFSLSLADLGYLVFMMAGKSHSILSLVDLLLGQYWRVTSLHTVVGIYWSFMTISSAITMIISLERCACVLAPLRAKTLIRARTMFVVVVCVYAFILGLYGIFNTKYVTVTHVDPDNANRTVYKSGLGSFYLRHRTIVDVIYLYFLSITVPAISLVVVVITTKITTAQLHLSLAWRQQSAQRNIKDSRELALTKMLMAICCVYVACLTPKSLMGLVEKCVPDLQPAGRYSNLFFIVNACMHVLSVVNSSVNFFFYYALGSRYRATLHSLCLHCWRNKS